MIALETLSQAHAELDAGHRVLVIGPPAISTVSALRKWTSGPFRAPHHTVSAGAMVGVPYLAHGPGGRYLGEIDLAYGGLLVLCDLPEFSRLTVGAIGDRLRSTRAIAVVATALPCPCGYLRSVAPVCACTPGMIARWSARRDAFAALIGIDRVTGAGS